MTNPSSYDLNYALNQFRGSFMKFNNPLYKTIHYTEGVRYFFQNAGEGGYWLFDLVANEMIKILKDDLFFIYLQVNQDQTTKITVQRDKGEPILYEKEIEYTDCPYSEEPYCY